MECKKASKKVCQSVVRTEIRCKMHEYHLYHVLIIVCTIYGMIDSTRYTHAGRERKIME